MSGLPFPGVCATLRLLLVSPLRARINWSGLADSSEPHGETSRRGVESPHGQLHGEDPQVVRARQEALDRSRGRLRVDRSEGERHRREDQPP
jgi:hypothetical protein